MENGGDSKDPSGFLSEIIGAPVTVKLNSSVVYRGRILDLREHGSGLTSANFQVFCRVWMAI